MLDKEELKRLLIEHEGYNRYPYKDSVGKITIGVGRNLTDNGLKEDEVDCLLEHDIDTAIQDAYKIFTKEFFDSLPNKVQMAIIDMLFNLGINRFKSFKKLIKAVKEKDFLKASKEAEDSKWCKEVKIRCKDVVKLFKGAING